MPRHAPRTIYKPIQVLHSTIQDTTAPNVAFFQSIRSVDADASQGLQLKHVETALTFGLTDAGGLDATKVVTGIMGFFKWPVDAGTPTTALLDLQNRSSIWNRRTWVVQGNQTSRYRITSKSMRLKLGDEIWFFIMKMQEADAATVLTAAAITHFFETQA